VKLNLSFSRGVTHDSTAPSQGACVVGSDGVACDLGELADTRVAIVTVQISPVGIAFIGGTASVVSGDVDNDMTNNRASITLERSGPPIIIDPVGTPV
jgi:hypothetical protein